MTSRDYCFWLQGFFEIQGKSEPLTVEQVDIIKRHLAMVFVHEIDPSFPVEQQDKLNEVHKVPFSPAIPPYTWTLPSSPLIHAPIVTGEVKPRC